MTQNGLVDLSSSVSCPLEGELGFHKAAGVCTTLVLSNGRHSVIASDDLTGLSNDNFQRTFDSITLAR